MDNDFQDIEKMVKERKDILSKPLDIEQLITNGVLKRNKGNWFEILNLDALPPQAQAQIGTVDQKNKSRVKFNRTNGKGIKISIAIKSTK